MSSSRTVIGVLLLLGPCGGVARAQDSGFGWYGPERLELVECSTAFVALTRPAPKVLSSRTVEDEQPWLDRDYFPSPDGRTLLVLLPGRLRVIRDGQVQDHDLPGGGEYSPPTLRWHPDSRRVALWVKETPPPRAGYIPVVSRVLAVLDVEELARPRRDEEPAPYQVLHRCSPVEHLLDLEWTPGGQALRIVGSSVDPEDNTTSGVVISVPLTPPGGGLEPRPLDLLRVAGDLDFAVGAADVGPVASTNDRLLVGHRNGLFVLGEGHRLTQLADLPSAGIHRVAWSPDRRRDQLLLFYRRPITSTTSPLYQGVFLLDLDAALASRPPEQLDDEAMAVRGLAFSPGGRWATWATPKGVYFRAPGAPREDTVRVSIPPPLDGDAPEVRGFAWSADETRLAIAAGNRLYVHDVTNQALYVVLEREDAEHTVVSQPTWIGDRVVVTAATSAFPRPRPGQRKGC